MQEILKRKLHDYIKENNPDILMTLQEENRLEGYLHSMINSVNALIEQLVSENKPSIIIEEICMDELTKPLRPSRFHFLKELLEQDFFEEYQHLLHSGILRPEINNLIAVCDPLFTAFGFSEENEDDKHLRNTVIGVIKEYFENSERENRVSWPTMPIKN
jgi:hypothetical protein